MRKSSAIWLFLIPDVILFYVALYFAVLIRYRSGLGSEIWQTHYEAFSLLFAVWILVYFIHGLFDVASLRRYSGLIIKITAASLVNLLAAVIYFYFQRSLSPGRFLLIDIAISFFLILAWHLLVKYFFKNKLIENLYLFSFGKELNDLESEISGHSYLGYRVLGHLNPNTFSLNSISSSAGIVLPDNLNTRPEILTQFYTLRKNGVPFYNYRSFYENLLRRVYLNDINELWFLENINYKEKRFYGFVKRLVDIIFGLIGLVVFLVSFIFVGLLIKLSSKGPILFTQARVGKDGKVFRVYKYRTMRTDQPSNTWTSVNDPRVTSIGKFLRKSRIDEWPQFINLVLGNMSLVGPRPEQPNIVESLRKQIPFYEERHLVKPGITGWAQINNIYAGSAEETKLKLQYDLYYIKHRSLFFDLEIILKTIYYIFTWQGR